MGLNENEFPKDNTFYFDEDKKNKLIYQEDLNSYELLLDSQDDQ